MREVTNIGRKNGDPKPDIVLAGIGIRDNHAYIEEIDGEFYLNPCDIESS